MQVLEATVFFKQKSIILSLMETQLFFQCITIICQYTSSLYQLIVITANSTIRYIAKSYNFFMTFDYVHLFSFRGGTQIASREYCSSYEFVVVCEICTLRTIISIEKTIHTEKSLEVYYPVNIGARNSWLLMHRCFIIILLYRVVHPVFPVSCVDFRGKRFVPLCTHT